MFLRLFQKECAQVGKSLIYWLYVVCLVVFFSSQMGSMKDNMLSPRKEDRIIIRHMDLKKTLRNRI